MKNFGANPGKLKCWLYLPTILAPKTPLVVVLHGCTQNAAAYDHGSGWSKLSEEKGFAVLFPEQQRANNANLCFNWFEPADTRRDQGEALAIREMIGHVIESQGIDPERVFITGLSAGGAMANVMLATYPELFAGGAIIGGLPYGTASGVGQAFERMRGHNPPSESQLQSAPDVRSFQLGFMAADFCLARDARPDGQADQCRADCPSMGRHASDLRDTGLDRVRQWPQP